MLEPLDDYTVRVINSLCLQARARFRLRQMAQPLSRFGEIHCTRSLLLCYDGILAISGRGGIGRRARFRF